MHAVAARPMLGEGQDGFGGWNVGQHAWTVRYMVGWKMTDADEAAIALLAAEDWHVSLHQDGTLQAEYGIAELTGLNTVPAGRSGCGCW